MRKDAYGSHMLSKGSTTNKSWLFHRQITLYKGRSRAQQVLVWGRVYLTQLRTFYFCTSFLSIHPSIQQIFIVLASRTVLAIGTMTVNKVHFKVRSLFMDLTCSTCFLLFFSFYTINNKKKIPTLDWNNRMFWRRLKTKWNSTKRKKKAKKTFKKI